MERPVTVLGLDASISSLNSVDPESSATATANVDTQPSKWTSTSSSVTASPMASRDSSPSRQTTKTTRPGRPSPPRSRNNSLQDFSSAKSRTSIPTATTPRQLSASTTPTLPPPANSDPILRTPVPQKVSVATDSTKDGPRWPISPRLKSPPPTLAKPCVTPSQSGRKNEQETPSINVQRATPSPRPQPQEPSSQAPSDNEGEEPAHLQTGMRTPARGSSSTLETVQEVSQPNSPLLNVDQAIEKLALAAEDGTPKADSTLAKRLSDNAVHSGSSSDSGSVKTTTRRSSTTAPPPLLHSRHSSTGLKFMGKGHTTGETSSRHMTVEEEEVDSIPRVSLGLATTGQGANGTLKNKPSSETIRPRKEKKKSTRKQPSVTSGTGEAPTLFRTATEPYGVRHSHSIRCMSSASNRSPTKLYGQGSYSDELMSPRQPQKPSLTRNSSITAHVTSLLTRGPRPASSKADIFEAKVASAVEEANSSDSDETFVYDSNPPDVDRPRRYHSRTPSATSMVSQVDRGGLRSIHSVLDGGIPNPTIKKNMKFVNTYNGNGSDSLNGFHDDDGNASSRSNVGSTRGTKRHHHAHAGRWSRNNNHNHLSLFDNESPFPNAARSKLSGSSVSRQTSNPTSPRYAAGQNGIINSKRQMAMSGGYDLDDTTTGADDERTPLLHINTNRSIRSARGRRTPMRERGADLEARSYRSRPSFLNRFASCLVLTIMLLLVITGAIGFMFATTQPLRDIELIKITNVLASEQELMMDISVRAHNPNVVVVTVDSADLEIFAKSPHAGTDSEWWRHPHGDDMDIYSEDGGPSDDQSPNMRLGNIVDFDSPLTFEGSFFQKGISTSTGELRLARPGNGTDSGTERWERILADEFTLVVRGVLKYSLPLSQRIRSATVSGKTIVKPNSANDPTMRPNGTDVEVGISKSKHYT